MSDISKPFGETLTGIIKQTLQDDVTNIKRQI